MHILNPVPDLVKLTDYLRQLELLKLLIMLEDDYVDMVPSERDRCEWPCFEDEYPELLPLFEEEYGEGETFSIDRIHEIYDKVLRTIAHACGF